MFSYQDNLLLKGFEYYAKFNLEHPVDWKPIVYQGHKFYYPAPSSGNPGSMPNNRILANELVYHHYVDRKGLDAPWLRTMMKLKNVDVLYGLMYTCSDTTTAYVPYPVPPCRKGWKHREGCTGLLWIGSRQVEMWQMVTTYNVPCRRTVVLKP